MPKQIHCGFLVAIVTRLSKDERRKLNELAAKEGVSTNVLVRRRLGFSDGAMEDAPLTTQTRSTDAAQEVIAANE